MESGSGGATLQHGSHNEEILETTNLTTEASPMEKNHTKTKKNATLIASATERDAKIKSPPKGAILMLDKPKIMVENIVRVTNQENGENWREVPDTGGLYLINRSGQIFSAKRQKYLRLQYPSNCSPTVRLPINGIFRTVGIARTVATLFLGEQKPGYKLIFKDHDSQNVDLSNLDYLPTRKEKQRQKRSPQK